MTRRTFVTRFPSRALSLLIISTGIASFANVPAFQAPTDQSVKQKTGNVVSYLSPTEDEILREVNLARTRPQQYAAYLEARRAYYSGKNFQPPGRRVEVTSEGASALDEAIRFLRAAAPLPALASEEGMCRGAKDHCKDIVSSGKPGHRGSDGSSPEDRLNRYGSWSASVGETIAYQMPTARDAVICWLIDDGVANRGHRRAIFNPAHRMVGIAQSECPTLGTIYVMNFADKFTARPTAATTAALPADAKPAARRY